MSLKLEMINLKVIVSQALTLELGLKLDLNIERNMILKNCKEKKIKSSRPSNKVLLHCNQSVHPCIGTNEQRCFIYT